VIKCLAVDDEPLALQIISDYVAKLPFLELAGTCASGLEALEFLQKNQVDLIFLDIQMPDLTGIQFLKSLRNPPSVILTTAYPDYALQGYELDVSDYLLKPISFDRFLKAVNKVQISRESNSVAPQTIIHTELQQQPHQPDFLFVKTEYKIVKVAFDDILYVEGLKDYVSIYTPSERIITLQNMKSMEGKLPGEKFFRVHKSYIVNISKIDSIERARIFIGKTVIPVGDTYRE
jgi:two-component system, LytTR family, response regulator